MHTATRAQTVQLGDLVAAVFDQATGFTPTVTNDVATRVVTDMLLRTDNAGALRALQRAARTGALRPAVARSLARS